MASRDSRWDEDDAPWRPGRSLDLPHSRLGIWSFVVAIVTTVALVGVAMTAIDFTWAGPPAELEQREKVATGLSGGCALLALIGLALGIAGCCQDGRQKVFAIIGLSFNGFLLLGAGMFVLVMYA